jgi:Fe-S-cluster containining protein
MDQKLEMEQINVQLTVGGEPIEMGMSVPVEPVKLRAMLPIFRQMSNSFISSGEDAIRASGKEISCKAGCGACCRQLVPVSEAETFDIRALIDAMPEPRRSELIERFRAGMEKFNSAGYFDKLDEAAKGSDEDYDEIIKEYFRFQVACPFLENESCSIHEARPITCREYLVTSPADLCDSAEGTGIENVRHFFQVKEAVISLSRDKTSQELPYIPMIRIMEWTDREADDSREQTGMEWMQGFFGQLAKYSKPA